jgi:hypothetical protein
MSDLNFYAIATRHVDLSNVPGIDKQLGELKLLAHVRKGFKSRTNQGSRHLADILTTATMQVRIDLIDKQMSKLVNDIEVKIYLYALRKALENTLVAGLGLTTIAFCAHLIFNSSHTIPPNHPRETFRPMAKAPLPEHHLEQQKLPRIPNGPRIQM